MNMNDLVGSAKGMLDDAKGNTDGENSGLSSVMDMAKDFDMETIEKFKGMSKEELLEEVKNSEHSAKVIEFIKGLIAQKSE